MKQFIKKFSGFNPEKLQKEKNKLTLDQKNELILQAECFIKTDFPKDYKNFIRTYIDGAYIKDVCIEIMYNKTGEKKTLPVETFFGINFSNDNRYSLIYNYELFKSNDMDSGIVPFADNIFSHLFVLYRNSLSENKIIVSDPYLNIFTYTEEDNYPFHLVANSFEEFIDLLKICP